MTRSSIARSLPPPLSSSSRMIRRLVAFRSTICSVADGFVASSMSNGPDSLLDEEKISLLTELGIKWKQPACEPRSKKKKRRKELFSSSEGNNDCKDSGGYEYDDESNDNNNGDDENIIVAATEEGRVDDDGSVI